MKWINRLYIFFLGIILSITTGFGIAAFYPEPIQPTYPPSEYNNRVPQSCYATPQTQSSPDCQAAFDKQKQMQAQDDLKRQQYENDLKVYDNKNAGYNRTAIFFGIVIGSIFAILGLGLIKQSKLIANGLLLAGLLTAILTRFLIILASLGASTQGTASADSLSFVEFGVLLVLSVVVIVVGLYSLKEHTIHPTNSPNPTSPN